MNIVQRSESFSRHAALVAAVALSFATLQVGAQSSPSAHTTHPTAAQNSSVDAAARDELMNLRMQVRALEQRVQAAAPQSMARAASQKMMMDDEDDDDMPMSPGMPSGAAMSKPSGSGMSMKMMEKMHSGMGSEMSGMGAMGGMKTPAALGTFSALPGFPGQSHLYHIGASSFFLDQITEIALTKDQQQKLARQKQQALLRQGDAERQVEAAEEKLWQLTAADQPQIDAIEKQIRGIEKLRADQRIAFIRAVGEAARLLTAEQRMQLTGTDSTGPAEDAAMSMPKDAPSKTDSMGHM
jgi:hypothetical protein